MKRISHLAIFATIFMISCQNTNKTSSQRFSTKLDTIYKDNSTDIGSIKRTIYQYGSYETGKMIALQSNNFNKNDLSIFFLDEKIIAVAIFEKPDLFKKFIKDARTVYSNPNKSLRFNFGALNEGTITSGIGEGTINLCSESTLSKTTYIDIAIAEVDSMESCYNRFLSEKK
jgi:hypothetical protein